MNCPRCGERIEVFGPSQAAHAARLIGAPLLGQIPLDSELSWRCDVGEIEDYRAEVFAQIAEQVVKRTPAVKTTPIFPQVPVRTAQAGKNK